MRVLKFGGTSVADAISLAKVARIVAHAAKSDQLVVVTSAQAGVTDALVAAADRGKTKDLVAALARRHFACLHAAGEAASQGAAVALKRWLDELARLLAQPATGSERPAWRDAVLACGERLAAPVVAAFLRAAGLAATPVDAADLVVTDTAFGEAHVDRKATCARVGRWASRLAPREVPVVTGFVGATADGRTTTLGRGGSDYSAAVLGAALEAACIEIWTDVAGIFSAPPRIVPEAVPLSAVSFAVARELAALGGKVLHPRTMDPAEQASIPIVVRSTFEPELSGTLVGPPSPQTRQAHVVTGIELTAVGTLAEACQREEIDILDPCLVAVVGENISRQRGALRRHAALCDRLRLPTLAVLPSSSGHALLSLHRRAHLRRVMTRLHAAVVLGTSPPVKPMLKVKGLASRVSLSTLPDCGTEEVGL